ncbi:MAG TPA: hypothetical protein VMH04_12430 [Candidatus Solibacter sp.]|nr:hypothetical protein [Candidatus Solibacter sp.]
MSNASITSNAVSQLVSQSDAVGRLAQDNGGFAAAVAALESRDASAFRWVLERVEMLPYCESICEWIRIKLCTLRCAEICRPTEVAEIPSLSQFARALVELSSNEKVLRRVVDAVACGDGREYQAALNELKLGEFCELICYWVCSVGYEEICRIVCRPEVVAVNSPVLALQAAGEVIAKVAKNQKVIDAISKAAKASDFDALQNAVSSIGLGDECHIICLLICIWWRVWVCRALCVVPPRIYTGQSAIEEAQSFALASRALAGQPRILGDLVSAAIERNAEAYQAIVNRFDLEPYCWQVCSWVVASICYGFCIRVCPPPGDIIPLFTKVGCYLVGPPISDFNPNGTTISGALAFTGTIPLIGLIPDGTATTALKYRFTYQDYSGVIPNPNPAVPITGAMVPATQIGTLEFQYWNGVMWLPGSVPFWVNNPGATATIPQEFGSPLTVSVNVDTDPSGWIQVPQLHDNSQGGTGLFTPAGAQGLIFLDTTKLTNEVFDLTTGTPLAAGDTMPAAALSQKPMFQINFEAQVVATSAPVSSNSLTAIALCNTSYKYIQHPEWPGGQPPVTSPVVVSVDILELDSEGGCARLDDTIHVLYTAYHPYIGSCRVFVQGPGVSGMTTPPGGSITLPIQPNQGQVLGTGNGVALTFNGTLTMPVLPGSVEINAGAVVGKDNGSGVISGAGISSGSITYATGVISVTFAAAPAVGVQVRADYDTNLASGSAGAPFDMSGLQPCAYMVWLQTTLNLTTGCGAIGGTPSDYIAFCTTDSNGS